MKTFSRRTWMAAWKRDGDVVGAVGVGFIAQGKEQVAKGRTAAGQKRHRHVVAPRAPEPGQRAAAGRDAQHAAARQPAQLGSLEIARAVQVRAYAVVHLDRKSTRLNSSHDQIS